MTLLRWLKLFPLPVAVALSRLDRMGTARVDLRRADRGGGATGSGRPKPSYNGPAVVPDTRGRRGLTLSGGPCGTAAAEAFSRRRKWAEQITEVEPAGI